MIFSSFLFAYLATKIFMQFVWFEVGLSFTFEIFCFKLRPTHNRFPQGFCNVWEHDSLLEVSFLMEHVCSAIQ